MKIYKAIQFHKVLSDGGSTRPWLVEILAEGEETQSFVVKVFKTDTLRQYNAVAHEAIANELAKCLDMSVPEKAFIDFPSNFIQSLPNTEKQLITSNHINRRLKFGTVLIDNAKIFSPQQDMNDLEEYEIEDIYAFDNLIQNVDRQNRKPNILFTPANYFLIDHELSFEGITDDYVKEIEADTWKYPYQKHIFHKKLKGLKDKQYTFDNFEENIRNLDFKDLENILQVLADNKYSYQNANFLLEYLRFIQTNIAKFKQILKGQIT